MYYKVVNANLRSAAVRKSMQIQYEPGVWVEPEFGKLMVFDSLVNAEYFSRMCGFIIYSCEAKNVTAAPPKLPNSSVETMKDIKAFWRTGVLPLYSIPTPPGTMIADAVMLLDKIRERRFPSI